MPEDTELPLPVPPVFGRLDGPIDTQKLVVAGHNLDQPATAFIKENEILEEINEMG